MKWLIIEDALRDRKGHWLQYVSTFVRGLRELGDEVVVLCDRKAEGFILEQTGARPVLPESIWHRMGDGAGALKRYLRVPGHAVATLFAMRKFFRSFNHRGHRDHGEESAKKQEINHENHEKARIEEAGLRPGSRAGAVFSNPFASKLARDSENTSLTRSASGPTEESLRADDMGLGSAGGNQLADSKEFLEGQSQAGLQMDNQKDPSIRTANDRSTSGEYSSSVPIREIRGSNSVTLDAERSTLDSGEAPDWIFVPTVLVHHLLGWWMLLKMGSLPKESRVLLFFPNLPIRLDEMRLAHWSGGPTTKLMAWLFGQLRNEVESGRVVLGVETHAMRRALEELIQMPVVYLPHPVSASTTGLQVETTNHTNLHERGRQGGAQRTCAGASEPDSLASELADSPVSELPTRSASSIPCFDPRPSTLDSRPKSPATSYPPPATSAKPIVFGCYGAARWEKGSDIFLKAIRLVLDGVISTTKCTKGHEKEEGISTTDDTDIHGCQKNQQGDAQGTCAGAAFSNPFTSELARDCENTSPTCSASGPAEALRAETRVVGSAGGNQLADSMGFLKGHSQAGLQVDNQKDRSIRLANDPSASGKNSSFDLRQPLGASPCGPTSSCSSSRLPERSVVSISEICGQNSSSSETSHSPLDSLHFVIQWVEDFQDGEGNQVSIDPWLKKHPQVEVIGRYFEEGEYEQRLAVTDVMALPYRSPYRLRVSRVVIEAMMNGMPVIATRGTTLFEQAEEYGVVVGCGDGDAESLAEAMLEMAARFETLRVNAEEKASAAAESFSVGYFRDLLGRNGG